MNHTFMKQNSYYYYCYRYYFYYTLLLLLLLLNRLGHKSLDNNAFVNINYEFQAMYGLLCIVTICALFIRNPCCVQIQPVDCLLYTSYV